MAQYLVAIYRPGNYDQGVGGGIEEGDAEFGIIEQLDEVPCADKAHGPGAELPSGQSDREDRDDDAVDGRGEGAGVARRYAGERGGTSGNGVGGLPARV